jgi:hypothetical protein
VIERDVRLGLAICYFINYVVLYYGMSCSLDNDARLLPGGQSPRLRQC